MNRIAGLFAGMFVMASCCAMVAQETTGELMGPPKVLVIAREFTKPGRDGAPHEKTESAFVSALTAARWPSHYLAMTSLSGRPRALFMFGYASFEAWEKDNHDMMKNATLSAALDRANVADGENLAEVEDSVYLYDPELSLRAGSVVHSRYFEISQYFVKPGHRAEWLELVKLYLDGYSGIPNANWATFESYYGENNGGVYIAITRMTSLAEDDAGLNDDKKFEQALGPEKMSKVRELTAACLDHTQTNLFEFSPKMSYPDPEWIKADPFWKPKAAAPAKTPASAAP